MAWLVGDVVDVSARINSKTGSASIDHAEFIEHFSAPRFPDRVSLRNLPSEHDAAHFDRLAPVTLGTPRSVTMIARSRCNSLTAPPLSNHSSPR